MNYFFGAASVGFYSVAQKTLNAPASLLSRAFSDVFFKEVSSSKSQFNANLEAFFVKNLKLLFLASLVILGVFFLVGKTVYIYLFGEVYIESYTMALYVIYFFLVRFIVTSMNSIVISKGLLKIDFKFNILLFVSQLIPLIIGGYLDYSIYVILPIMCVLGILAYLYLFSHTYRLIKNNSFYE